jgi:hypothetical protein
VSAASDDCCPSTVGFGPERWWCTLDVGHQLPVWDDDGIVRYVGDEPEDDE